MNSDGDDNLDSVSKKIFGDVKKIRNNEGSKTDSFIDGFKIFPKFMMKFVDEKYVLFLSL